SERLSPKLVDLQQRFQGFESQKTDRPKRASAPHNLYDPVAHDGGVRGDFTADASRRSVYQSMEQHAPALAALAGAGMLLAAAAVDRDQDRRAAPVLLRALGAGLVGKAIVALTWQR
ncbi:MAG TPA: hypothetical protein VF039_02900, partial [Longimicrobiales bacterium]